MSLTFIDLFAGIGGFRLGMEQAGHKCLGYVEWDKFARKSYEAIHNTKGEWTAHDITTVTDDDLRLLRGTVDVICGGFPCQAFSIAGKRLGFAETRGTLFFEIARFAKEIQPQYLFLENVKGLLNHDGGNTFRTILSTLDELGYDAEWQLLNSKDYGVPQNRERVFIIGHLRGRSRREVFPIRGSYETPGIKIVGSTKNHDALGTNYRHSVHDVTGIVGALSATDYKQPKQVIVKGMLDIKGKDQIRRVYGTDGISPCLTTMQGGGQEPKIIQYNIEMPVTVRKYEVDIDGLKMLLKESKVNSGKSIKQISDELEAKKTTVEHWFRNDQCFSIPDADIWFRLKKVLNIENNAFDASITEFIEKPNEYEKAGRVYHVDGLAPTLTRASADEKIVQPVLTPTIIDDTQGFDGVRYYENEAPTLRSQRSGLKVMDKYRIRKLTPRECWRLQGFPDWAFDRAREVNSDSQLYKQAGNSVTVNVIHAIAERLV
ncbi:DNA cytosine methyltransferase [Bacillus cereus group sp. MYBK225-1]|uniref:DNA cytosine methyltransferase n=1 Tax=Bacillus cereus group sp. MYBK225-1 TaxID=3450656 RepID=UPI003F796F3C